MSRRLPAPPPGEPRSGPPPDPALPDPDDRPEPDEEPWDDDPEEDDGAPVDDLPEDPEDDPLVPEEDPQELDDLDPLEALVDDEVDDDPTDEPPLEDELADLGAPDDHELPILTWRPRVRVDGVQVPARLDPVAPATRWVGAPFDGTRRVLIEVGGVRIPVDLASAVGAQDEIVLGNDVLAGRFLLRL